MTVAWEDRERYDPALSTIGCPKGCYDMDWCLASLVQPCARERTKPDPTGQFNPACGCLERERCPGCQICTTCEGCFCNEE